MTSVQGMKNRRITQLSPAQISDPHISSLTLKRPLISKTANLLVT